MELYRWFDRKFAFDSPIWAYPNIVSRLRGAPARLDELVQGLSRDILTRRDGDRWSIQEHAGHLWDVETLWDGRLDDFEAGIDELRPADLENQKTHEANHNDSDITILRKGFRGAREAIVERLDGYDERFVKRSALHPRLNQPMRVLDLIVFVAEHDDHHLARISELTRKFRV